MSIFGKALRGFGMLKKTSSAKKKFDAKRKVFGEAAKRNELTQVTKKLKKTVDEVEKSMARAKKNYPFLKLKD